MKIFTLNNDLWLPFSPQEVFHFFADASNLEKLTPPALRFEILTPTPIEMKVGALIDYRIRLRGIPMRWQSEITAWQPPHRFVDEQRRGPYRLWVHEHTFAPLNDGALAKDIVRYAVPGGAIAQRLLIAPELKRIFDYRNAALKNHFRAEPRMP